MYASCFFRLNSKCQCEVWNATRRETRPMLNVEVEGSHILRERHFSMTLRLPVCIVIVELIPSSLSLARERWDKGPGKGENEPLGLTLTDPINILCNIKRSIPWPHLPECYKNLQNPFDSHVVPLEVIPSFSEKHLCETTREKSKAIQTPMRIPCPVFDRGKTSLLLVSVGLAVLALLLCEPTKHILWTKRHSKAGS